MYQQNCTNCAACSIDEAALIPGAIILLMYTCNTPLIHTAVHRLIRISLQPGSVYMYMFAALIQAEKINSFYCKICIYYCIYKYQVYNEINYVVVIIAAENRKD